MTNWRKVISLPFTGPSATGLKALNRTTTAACWDGSVDGSGNLLDTTAYGRNLAPAGTPTRSVSALQGQDGNRLVGRDSSGASAYYSLAHAAWMNMFSADFTITIVSASASNGCVLLAHGLEATSGIYMQSETAGIRCRLSKSGSYATLANTSIALNDNRQHVIQVVRRSGIGTVYVDGVAGTPVSVATYGIDGSATLYMLAYDGSGNAGSVTYCRLDAEALSDARLAYEQQILSGIAAGTTWGPSMDFSRAGTAYQTYGDGTMALRSSGMPRVGDGVLIEGAATNLFNSQRDLSGWNFQYGTNTANQGTGPDGTVYLDKLTESVDNGDHLAYQTKTLPASTHTMEATIQAGGRGFGGFWTSTSGNDYVIWNLTTGAITKQDAEWVTAGSNWLANGNLHIWATIVGDATANDYGFVPSTDGTTTSYAGDVSKGIIIGDMHLRLGAFPTSYTDSAAGTRVADDLSIPTYRLRNTLKDIVSTTPTMWLDFDVDPSGATITDKSGAYTLTKAGQPKRYTSTVYGDYHLFDGVSDYYTIPNTLATPTGSFSVSVVYTPTNITQTGYVFSKWLSAGNQRSFSLSQTSSSIAFTVDKTGAGGQTSVTKSSALVAGKPVLITATYQYVADGSSVMNVYVDALTVATSPIAVGPVFASTAKWAVVANENPDNFLNGKLHYLAYYNGTVLSATDHSNLYAALKLPGVLPTAIGSGQHYTKLRFKFDMKCLYGSYDTSRRIISISGSPNTVYAEFVHRSDGLRFETDDGDGTSRYFGTAVRTDWNKWHTVDVVIDMTNLAASTYTLDGVNAASTSGNWTGTHSLSLLDKRIRLGQGWNDAVDGNCFLKNLEIFIGND